MIDLHIHTTNSDGTDNVKEVLKKAENLGLEYIAITDHENCNAHKQLRDMQVTDYYTGNIITGAEVKCFYQGKIIEILGYNIHIDGMSQWLEDFYRGKSPRELQVKYFNHYYQVLEKMGIKLLPKNEIEWIPGNDWASCIIYREIKRFEENQYRLPKDLWEDFNNFKLHYCYNPKTELYVDKSHDTPDIKDVLSIIKEVGGYSFLAHPYMYLWFKDSNQFISDIIDNYKIDGIETYYSKFTQDQIQYLLELTKEKKLYRSGGTDYHGRNKKGIELGIGRGDLQVPKDILEDWYLK